MAKPDVTEVPEVHDEMHLDDFLNAIESQGKHELLSAFAYSKKKVNEYKKTLEAWRVDFKAFENSKPE